MKRLSPARRFCALAFFAILPLLLASCSSFPRNTKHDGPGAAPPTNAGDAPSPEAAGVSLSADEGLLFLNGSPWTKDTRLDKLPVYRNPFYEDRDTLPEYFEQAALYHEAEGIAKTLSMEITDFTYESYVSFRPYPLPPEGKARQIYARTDSAHIGITMSWTEVSFHAPQRLPEGFELKDDALPREDMLRLLSILAEEYGPFLGYEKPVPAVWTSPQFDGSYGYTYIVYDGKGDISDQILGYNFGYTVFHIYGDGLHGFRKRHGPERYEYLGDYEIISWQEAQEQLLDGAYNTPYTFFDELPGQNEADGQLAHTEPGNGYRAAPSSRVKEEQIAHVELVYRVQNEAEFLMPCYRFHVKVDASEPELVKTDTYYEWYDVPAVKDYEDYGFIAHLTLLQ